ncbi:MAG TPA: chemotaxis response regulator protein-glutamate methylesterase [Syntrophorhabdaceae bacterium]|nr:chemotaxis response regulator protein-glutamate methylesterase [Syntrophorhabdaceae bacterium]
MIRVLVVDDSLVMRKTISRMLSKDPHIEVVGTGVDGLDALEKIESLKPDVVTLDIEMPVMDGLEALRRIMSKEPIPVIMMSALTKEGAEVTMEALTIGACDFVTKDFANVSSSIEAKQVELVSKVKNVARNKVRFLLKKLDITKKPVDVSPDQKIKHEVLSIGASTGGPPALQHILTSLHKNFPVPIVIAQHMPKLFTQSFSQRLDAVSQIHVKEAEENEPLRPGVALIAPGNTHVALKRRGKEIVVEFVNGSQYIYRPSVDLLMSSTATVYEQQAIGVILTGMGNDGLIGMKEMKLKHGYIIAQDEETCVVFGMPKAVIGANLADVVLPIDRISEEIMRVL